ncbi:MAG TPA: PaaI family thioesterase [Anaerolineales bacterium]|nr:PaaI family thioesterase [Anaerolineales bacterium]
MMEKIREHGSCFVCGKANPNRIGVEWYFDDGNHIEGSFIFTIHHQGPPGFVHGGASAAVLDEAMGASVWRAGFRAAAVNLNTTFIKPVPLEVRVQVIGEFIEKKDKHIFTQGEIRLPDGTVAVKSKGVYVEAPHLFNELTSHFEARQS